MAEGSCVSSSGLIIEPALSQRAMDHSPQFLHSKYKIQYLNFNFFFFLVGRMVDYFANVLLHLP